jgi:hypothetical protein
MSVRRDQPRGSAAEYLRILWEEMRDGYRQDCVRHAVRLSEILAAEGRAPWIARLRHVTSEERGEFHWPLTPLRYRGRGAPTWTTHYVACADGLAFDPLAEHPIPVASYSAAVFAIDVPLVEHFDSATTAAHLRDGTLSDAFRPGR